MSQLINQFCSLIGERSQTVHGRLQQHNEHQERALVHVSVAARPGLLSLEADPAPRSEAAESADKRERRAQAGRLWPGARQVHSDQDLLERGGHSVVPTARRAPRLHGLLDSHRHVGRGLHLLRDDQRQAPVPGHQGRGRALLDLQDARLARRGHHARRERKRRLRRSQLAQVSALRSVQLQPPVSAPRGRRRLSLGLFSQGISQSILIRKSYFFLPRNIFGFVI
jgi:hypothetical protein